MEYGPTHPPAGSASGGRGKARRGKFLVDRCGAGHRIRNQSENQKSDLQEKFENIVSSKGYQSIVSSISDKSIKSTHVISGSIDANETLQKVDIGEYEIISVEELQNSDGTISIKIKAQPSSGN